MCIVDEAVVFRQGGLAPDALILSPITLTVALLETVHVSIERRVPLIALLCVKKLVVAHNDGSLRRWGKAVRCACCLRNWIIRSFF